MADSSSEIKVLRLQLSASRRRVWLVSGLALILSVAGLLACWFNPEIGTPLRPGLDFTGGTQIQLERDCGSSCRDLKALAVSELIRTVSQLSKHGSGSLSFTGDLVCICRLFAAPNAM